MKRLGLLGSIAVGAMITSPAVAQQPLASGSPVAYDFSTFDGSGFDSPAAAGQLDSNEWIALLSPTTGIMFGGTGTGADYANGVSDGGTGTGGVYAFDVDNIPVGAMHQYALGIQPTGSDFTRGSLQVRVTNMTGNTLNALSLSFDFIYRNDQPRSSRMSVRVIRESDGAEIAVGSLQRDTPAAAATVAAWVGAGMTLDAIIDISSIGIPAGENVIVSFDFDDNPDSTATGNRDELAIDNVTLSVPPCGNYTVDGAEACDDGNIADETACPYGMATCTFCNSTCTMELTLTGPACGDGTTDTADGEVCDDGNTVDETGCTYGTMTCTACSADCHTSLSLMGSSCGDGAVDSTDGEICDDGNTATETECAYGTMSCTLCAGDCSADLALTGRYCGDGTVDGADGEACDDANTTDGDGCSASCAMEMADGGVVGSDGGIIMDDAGVVASDGGVMMDGGTTDGGTSTADAGVDAGVADAGAGTDAGANDAAIPEQDAAIRRDAGAQVDGGTTMEAGGCGCTVPGGGSAPAPLALLAIGLGAALIRRRR